MCHRSGPRLEAVDLLYILSNICLRLTKHGTLPTVYGGLKISLSPKCFRIVCGKLHPHRQPRWLATVLLHSYLFSPSTTKHSLANLGCHMLPTCQQLYNLLDIYVFVFWLYLYCHWGLLLCNVNEQVI